MSEYNLKTPEKFSIFSSTEPKPEPVQGLTEITLDNLHHYKHHKYKLYSEERHISMIESVKAHGILTPLIVRPLDSGYEILAGHNRYEAAKAAGLSTVPCIIKEVSDIDAKVIVHVTNADQRSLAEYSHSERAAIIADYHEAMKQQGKRTDLLKDIAEALASDEPFDDKQTAQEKFGLSKATIARYIRLDKLIPEFKEMLDDDVLKTRTGVELSYLDQDNQMALYNAIENNGYKIDHKAAQQIRQIFEESNQLTDNSIDDIFTGKEKSKKTPTKITINRNKLKSYFPDDESTENIENTLITALEFYLKHKEKIDERES